MRTKRALSKSPINKTQTRTTDIGIPQLVSFVRLQRILMPLLLVELRGGNKFTLYLLVLLEVPYELALWSSLVKTGACSRCSHTEFTQLVTWASSSSLRPFTCTTRTSVTVLCLSVSQLRFLCICQGN